MSHKLTPKQLKAIYLLARGLTNIEVAYELKLRRETLSRWKRLPHFTAEFERIIEEQRAGMAHRLTNLVDASLSAVRNEVGRYESDPKRIQAALSVLKLLGIDKLLRPNECETPRKAPKQLPFSS